MMFQRRNFRILLFGSCHLLHQIALAAAFHFGAVFILTKVSGNVIAIHLKRYPNPHPIQALIQNRQHTPYRKPPQQEQQIVLSANICSSAIKLQTFDKKI